MKKPVQLGDTGFLCLEFYSREHMYDIYVLNIFVLLFFIQEKMNTLSSLMVFIKRNEL